MKTQRFDGARSPLDAILRNPDDPFPIGSEILGKYKVERILGKGGMGAVVAARHMELGCLHAIKFLLPGTTTSRQFVERFSREARAAANLHGEHVTRVHDVGKLENGDPYMVMEYLDGQDLKSVLRNGPLPIDVAVTYLLQVCEALSEAHAAGIVHRDLKPANLYLTKRPNGSACIKVLDFGIAKVVRPDETDLTAKDMVGTLKYMGPDQIMNSRSVDHRADIWAIGVIAYELVAGKAPFGGPSQVDLISSILSDEQEPPSSWRKDLPPAIEAVILRCLRKRREERIQSAEELANALREAAGIAVESHTMARMPMPSSSVISESPRADEKTRMDGTRTIPESKPGADRLKVLLAAGAATVTLALVMTLLLALRRQPTEAAVASDGPGFAAEAPSAPSAVPASTAQAEVVPIAAPLATDDKPPVSAHEDAPVQKKRPLKAPRDAQTATPAMTILPPWEAPTMATSARPVAEPPPAPKPAASSQPTQQRLSDRQLL